jgi:hypothetical protein
MTRTAWLEKTEAVRHLVQKQRPSGPPHLINFAFGICAGKGPYHSRTAQIPEDSPGWRQVDFNHGKVFSPLFWWMMRA